MFVSWVMPSASTIMPRPPDTARMLFSKSSCSSRFADQSSARILLRVGSDWSKSVCCEMDLRGPAGKIHTTLSVVAKGEWQAAHEPQPLLDMRPVIGVVVFGAGSNSPIDVL